MAAAGLLEVARGGEHPSFKEMSVKPMRCQLFIGLHALLLAPEQQVGHPRTDVSLSGHAAIA